MSNRTARLLILYQHYYYMGVKTVNVKRGVGYTEKELPDVSLGTTVFVECFPVAGEKALSLKPRALSSSLLLPFEAA